MRVRCSDGAGADLVNKSILDNDCRGKRGLAEDAVSREPREWVIAGSSRGVLCERRRGCSVATDKPPDSVRDERFALDGPPRRAVIDFLLSGMDKDDKGGRSSELRNGVRGVGVNGERASSGLSGVVDAD